MLGHLNAFLGLARTGNYLGMTEADLEKLQRDEPGIVCALSPLLTCSPNVLARHDPDVYLRRLRHAYDALSSAGAHYVVDDITSLPRVVDDINRRLVRELLASDHCMF